MNQQEHSSQLSALFDNELSAEQAELVIRRALKDAAMRTSWGRYALIGACLRGEPLAGRMRPESDVAARVRIRLAVEASAPGPTGLAGEGRPRGGGTLARGALGMAIAASVAAVSLLLIRTQVPQTGAMLAQSTAPQAVPQSVIATPAVAPAPRAMVARNTAPPSYTTPVDTSPAGQRLGAPLVNYVAAHSEVSSSVVRFSPMSTVMNSGDDLTQGTVEMTAAEIGARR